MFHGASVPTRLLHPMKNPFATACAGCSSFQRYCDSPATVADGLKTISAPFSPRSRAPSGKWRAEQRETPPLAVRGWEKGKAEVARFGGKFSPKAAGVGVVGFL